MSESFELSDSDLDNVAGGTGYKSHKPHKYAGGFAAGFSTGTAIATGSKLALTNTENHTVATSKPGFQAACSTGHSASIAAS